MTKYGMAIKRQSSTFEVTNQEVVIPSNNGGSDGSVLLLTGHKLNGHNLLQWSQSVMMFICRKGKDDYLPGVATPPKKGDLRFRVWKSKKNIVMSWLINSMNNDIGENFLLYVIGK